MVFPPKGKTAAPAAKKAPPPKKGKAVPKPMGGMAGMPAFKKGGTVSKKGC